MLFYIFLEAILVFINPVLGAIGVPVCVLIHIIKTAIFGEKKPTKHEYDEFDYWQDNQGL